MFNSIDSKRIPLYFCIFIVIMVLNTLGKKFSDSQNRLKSKDEYELIRKYLLNDSSFGDNKPKLWVHSKYNNHAGVWKSKLPSPSELEHPYIDLIVKTIVDHCHDDFNICLIDDDSFSKLIPNWVHNINTLPDPHKTYCREFGMATLLYIYGGIIVPNSFLCFKSLKSVYEKGISNSKPFVGEFVNHKEILFSNNKRESFIPDTKFIGAKKGDIVINQLVEYYNEKINKHFSSESEFQGQINAHLSKLVKFDRVNLVDGKHIGTKNLKNKPIILDDLMDDNILPIQITDCLGIYIPHDELMRRTKHQWLTISTTSEVLKSKTAISRFLNASLDSAIKK